MVYFQTNHPILGKFWKVLQTEDIGIFYGDTVYFMAEWYILWPFCGKLVYFFPFWYVAPI
jgi:hypothetical protein